MSASKQVRDEQRCVLSEDEEQEKAEEKGETLLTTKEPSRMITELFLARFIVLKKVVMDRPTDGQTLI